MSQQVEVNLRIPNMKVRALDDYGYPIDPISVRFKKLFVVACRYSNRSMSADDYDALENDSEWQMRPFI